MTGAVGIAAFLAVSPLKADVDWRTKGAVTPVKNTGSPSFDASWAFAVTGAVEGEHTAETGVLIALSEQELIDCVGTAEGDACADPLCGQAPCGLDYAVNHGLCTESSYPYTARPGSCKTCTPAVTLGGWSRIPPGDESALVAAINQSPVIARLEIGDHGKPLAAYAGYVGGIFSAPRFDDSVHRWVLIVGYFNGSGGDGYYIVKNSLGTSWGAQGYLYLARGGNELGVADNAYSPVGTTAHGACALPGGSCEDMSPGACLAAGGTYGGDLTFCPAPCSACDTDTKRPDIHASVKPGKPKKATDSVDLTVKGKVKDNCAIDPSTAQYWITDSADPGAPIVTTPIVLDERGEFTFTVTLDGKRPGKPDHRYRIFLSVEDIAGNERTVSLEVH